MINSFARFRNGPEDHVDLANKLQASVKLSQKVKQTLNHILFDFHLNPFLFKDFANFDERTSCRSGGENQNRETEIRLCSPQGWRCRLC